MTAKVQVYAESGTKRAFAGAIEWPGWCRSGRRSEDAVEALLEYAPRYAAVMSGSVRGFTTPRTVADLDVVEQLAGDSTTDFGAPSIAPSADARPLDARELSVSSPSSMRHGTRSTPLWPTPPASSCAKAHAEVDASWTASSTT
jgi:hypothetical protein